MNRFRMTSSAISSAAAVLMAFAALAQAAAAPGDDAERARIAVDRAAIESGYAERERECRTRFVVTSCVDEARGERRHGLDALRVRQLKLDEARRRERTAERRAELAGKAAEDARREQERAASAPVTREARRPLEPRHEAPTAGGRAPAPGVAHDRPAAVGDGLGTKRGVRESAAERRGGEARHRVSFETRQRQAAEHRENVEDKAAQRLKQRPPAAQLPVPASAPAR